MQPQAGGYALQSPLVKNKTETARRMNSWIYSIDSHTGRVRSANEDSYVANPQAGYWLIADGMGGHAAGDVASQLACQACSDALAQGTSIERAIEIAHRAVRQAIEQGLGAPNMGTTIVVATIRGNQLEIGWIGDSRAYVYNGFQLRQLSRDHSYVQSLVDMGTITPAEALRHPERNVIMQSLGASDEKALEIGRASYTLKRNDRVLLCSDGLSSELSHSQLSTLLRKHIDPNTAVAQLIDAALTAGGKDNITCAVIQRAECSQPPASSWFRAQLARLQEILKRS